MVLPKPFASLRRLSRVRREIVRDRVRLRTQMQDILDLAGFRIGGALPNAFDPDGMRILEGLAADTSTQTIMESLSPHVEHDVEDLRNALMARPNHIGRFLLTDHLKAWKSVTRRIATYDAAIAQGLSEFGEPMGLLMTIPGISRESACAILLELGPDIRAFESRQQCVAFAGFFPGKNDRADQHDGGAAHRRKPLLRTILIECAEAAVRARGSEFRSYHEAVTARKGHQHAIVATANKLVRIIYGVLSARKPYRDPRSNGTPVPTDPEPERSRPPP